VVAKTGAVRVPDSEAQLRMLLILVVNVKGGLRMKRGSMSGGSNG